MRIHIPGPLISVGPLKKIVAAGHLEEIVIAELLTVLSLAFTKHLKSIAFACTQFEALKLTGEILNEILALTSAITEMFLVLGVCF